MSEWDDGYITAPQHCLASILAARVRSVASSAQRGSRHGP
jgi:hypothetical protein